MDDDYEPSGRAHGELLNDNVYYRRVYGQGMDWFKVE